ncbi:7 transmembrane receptor [Necator americanus]|uniref:7 transmembrane receptor n=1 Tax=Necator americanus TaxID=51031 RepID=W2TMW7_NECAM|nr:7 transmembrane receptor [Necator americanus]ETN83118.1 7 transmembrane receptor [Necator americanus]
MDYLLVYAVAELLLSVHISLSNLLVLYVYVRKKDVRTVTNTYIFSLALTDFLAGCLGIPVTVISVLTRRPKSFYGCLFVHLILCILCTISTFHMLAIAVDKYVTICCRDQLFRSRHSRAVFLIALCWVSGTFIAVMPLFNFFGFAEVVSLDETTPLIPGFARGVSIHECFQTHTLVKKPAPKVHRKAEVEIIFAAKKPQTLDRRQRLCGLLHMKISRTESAFHAADDMCYFTKVVDYRYLVYVIFVGTILAPTILIVFCYVSIYSRIRKEEIQIKFLLRKSERDRRLQGRRKLIRILLILVVSYGICWSVM